MHKDAAEDELENAPFSLDEPVTIALHVNADLVHDILTDCFTSDVFHCFDQTLIK